MMHFLAGAVVAELSVDDKFMGVAVSSSSEAGEVLVVVVGPFLIERLGLESLLWLLWLLTLRLLMLP